ncbi:MAG: hypothetical protein ACPLRY_07100 [Candidatus Bathyarchaeales archaeon]
MGKVRIEIYDSDPFLGGCCSPGGGSIQAAMRLMKMLNERAEIVAKLQKEFKNVEITREIVNPLKQLEHYPEYARPYIASNTPLPFVLINGQLAVVGTFPTLEEFIKIINEHLK